MKIVFCDNSLKSLINFRKEIINHYAQTGYSVYLVYPNSTFDKDICGQINKHVEYIGVDLTPSSRSVMSDIIYLCQLIKIYKKLNPDIILHYTIKPNLYGTLAAKFLRLKSVAIVAGLGYIFNRDNLLAQLTRLIYKIALRLSDRVVVLNEDNYQKLLNEGYVKSKNLIRFEYGEGVNLSEYPYFEDEFSNVRFLMISRVLIDKGYYEYIEASKLVREKYPEIRIELLGPYDNNTPMCIPKDDFEKHINSGLINYLGETSCVQKYLSEKGTVLICCSHHEGMNRSIMEACSMGRPIITSDIPGCKEMVLEGYNGYLYRCMNSQELSNKMETIIKMSADERKKLSYNSFEFAKEHLNVQNVILLYDKIIKDIY